MKKALAVFLVFGLILSLGAVYAVGDLETPTDQVLFKETTLYGDRAFAEGLQVEKVVQLESCLVWDSQIEILSSGLESHTTHFYTPNAWNDIRIMEFERDYPGVLMYDDLPYSFETDGPELSFLADGLSTAQKALAEETDQGEKKEKTICLADYYTYVPIRFDIDLPGFFQQDLPAYERSEYEGTEMQPFEKMREFFRIPLQKEASYTLGVEKDEQGEVVRSWGFSEVERDYFSLFSFSVVTEEACFFTFDNHTQQNQIVDTSQIPGGYGIYVLPFAEKQKDSSSKGKEKKNTSSPEYDLLTDELKVFYPIDPQRKVLGLSLSQDQKTLFLQTEENGRFVITTIRIATGEAEQRFDIADYSMEKYIEVLPLEGTLLVRIEQSLSVLTPISENEWQILFQTVPTELEMEDSFIPLNSWYGRGIAFDGQRLAIISSIDVNRGCDFALAVYDSQGLEYYGKYESSLGQTNIPELTMDKRIYDFYNPNRIHWN